MHSAVHSCPFLLSMRNYLVTLSPALLFIAIFVIKMLIYLQISTTVLFKVNLCLSSNLNWYIGRKLWDYCKNRKNKILFFNLWFVLFCEITDKWGEALSLATLALSETSRFCIILSFENTPGIIFSVRGIVWILYSQSNILFWELCDITMKTCVHTYPHNFLIVGLRVLTAWVRERFLKASVFLDHTQFIRVTTRSINPFTYSTELKSVRSCRY